MKGKRRPDHLLEGNLRDLLDDEQPHAEGWREEADHEVECHHDPEVDGVDVDRPSGAARCIGV